MQQRNIIRANAALRAARARFATARDALRLAQRRMDGTSEARAACQAAQRAAEDAAEQLYAAHVEARRLARVSTY